MKDKHIILEEFENIVIALIFGGFIALSVNILSSLILKLLNLYN